MGIGEFKEESVSSCPVDVQAGPLKVVTLKTIISVHCCWLDLQVEFPSNTKSFHIKLRWMAWSGQDGYGDFSIRVFTAADYFHCADNFLD